MRKIVAVLCLVFLIISCTNDPVNENYQFSLMSEALDFSNNLKEEELVSVFNYINLYTGSGVAIGDINNDGLQDIFLGANMKTSKLYLNKGNFEFEDITEKAGVSTTKWVTGVTMGDVNGDGWLDIYVCRSYHNAASDRANLLFLNNQNGTFTEVGEQFGVADSNYSINALFFDYDLDGDEDLFVGNHPRYRALSLQTHYNLWLNPIDEFSNNLYRNDGGRFTKVTRASGLLAYGFTLGAIASDYDLDGYPDLFVTVDHDEPDIVYHNEGDGTFKKVTDKVLNQTSLSSMGIDVGDINNDKYPDYIVAEMLTEDHYREKVNMGMSSVKRFEYLTDTLKYNYYQMHNYLHLNNGNGTFSDIGQLANVHKSDWSWATLFMDYDHDGDQDLFISNGLYKEVFNKDRKGKLDSMMIALNGDMSRMNKLANDYGLKTPQDKISNYLFVNDGNLSFNNKAIELGLGQKTISTGAAYGDLDNDGDLDLVVNNLGDKTYVYRNNTNNTDYIRFGFKREGVSPIGAKVYVYQGDETQSREMLMSRGFLSSVEPFVHFGLGGQPVDKVEVIWPNGKMQVLTNVKTGETTFLSVKDATLTVEENNYTKLMDEKDPASMGLNYTQNENYYYDYGDQVLLPHRMSEYGPFICSIDANKDGLDDIVIGSPKGQSTELYLQESQGKFRLLNVEAFKQDIGYEDARITSGDFNGDGNNDLVIGSTGYEHDEGSFWYQPRLYLGDGRGGFSRKTDAFGDFSQSASDIVSTDINGDGKLDVIVCGRDRPKLYPNPANTTIWVNDGKGAFQEATEMIVPDLKAIGMVRDLDIADLDGDGDQDMLVVGEWMSPVFLINEGGKYVNKSKDLLLQPINGWWNEAEVIDLDNDGVPEIVLGNLGLNYKYKATDEKPFLVYAQDFDKSGTCDIVLGTYYGDELYPVRGRTCSSEQMPDIAKKFPTFEAYAKADIIDVYGESLNSALKYEVNNFAHGILTNKGGKYEFVELPKMTQRSPINTINFIDVNKDGMKDLVLAGNLYQSEIETGRADAGIGNLLLNKGNLEFDYTPNFKTGVYVTGDVKSSAIVDDKYLIFGRNRNSLQVFKI